MFGRGRAGSSDGGSSPSTADQSVRVAEEIVRRAWATVLSNWRDHVEFELRAADQDCDAAYAAMIAALRDGSVERIAAARVILDQAFETARAAALDCDRVRRRVRMELDLLTRRSVSRPAVTAGPRRRSAVRALDRLRSQALRRTVRARQP